jgi:hypothetical protein
MTSVINSTGIYFPNLMVCRESDVSGSGLTALDFKAGVDTHSNREVARSSLSVGVMVSLCKIELEQHSSACPDKRWANENGDFS